MNKHTKETASAHLKWRKTLKNSDKTVNNMEVIFCSDWNCRGLSAAHWFLLCLLTNAVCICIITFSQSANKKIENFRKISWNAGVICPPITRWTGDDSGVTHVCHPVFWWEPFPVRSASHPTGSHQPVRQLSRAKLVQYLAAPICSPSPPPGGASQG